MECISFFHILNKFYCHLNSKEWNTYLLRKNVPTIAHELKIHSIKNKTAKDIQKEENKKKTEFLQLNMHQLFIFVLPNYFGECGKHSDCKFSSLWHTLNSSKLLFRTKLKSQFPLWSISYIRTSKIFIVLWFVVFVFNCINWTEELGMRYHQQNGSVDGPVCWRRTKVDCIQVRTIMMLRTMSNRRKKWSWQLKNRAI